MAKNALEILSDNTVLDKFKEGAYHQAKTFDIHTILPEYGKLYNSLIN